MTESQSIIDFVKGKLAADSRPTLQIAAEAGMKYRWIHKLRNDELPRPGAHLIDALARYYGFYAVEK